MTPPVHRAVQADGAALRRVLNRAPLEFTAQALDPAEIALPMPDGTFARFHIVESPVMAPELAAMFPGIKTYVGQGIDDPQASARLDWTPAGFHAQILSPRGAVYIDPLLRDDTEHYASYYKREYRRAADGFICLAEPGVQPALAVSATLLRSGDTLRTYRLACAATGEYTQFHGGTVVAGMAAIVTAVNRVTGIYELELAVRFELVANNDQIVYTSGTTDPYSNNSGSQMLSQNQSNLDAVIGGANYDIGHVLSTGGGGIASLGVVCVSGVKARGVTGLPNPIGDPFYVDFVAHEMGHQFGANHTFNSVTGNCGGGNRNAATAYEPGSGSTIMAYAGICGADDLQPNSDPYFHSVSFDEIRAYVTTGAGSGCPVQTATGNTAPSVSAGADYTVPRSTPFALTAGGTDADGDILTFCWEERDLGPEQSLADSDNGASPLFRSLNPDISPSRTFPAIESVLNNTTSTGERYPTTTRTMSFRVTARDNRAGGGGVDTDDAAISVNAGAGPFVVTMPNTATTLAGIETVTWDVAGTDTAPIGATHVNILLSTNGGFAFPVVLASNTPNDGSELVVLPNLFTTNARVKVEAAGNIFFDISDEDFTVNFSTPTPLVIADSAALAFEDCAPTNGAVDPGETVTVDLALRNIGTGDTTDTVATLLPGGGVIAPSPPQDYGVLAAGGGAVAQSFSFLVDGACGDSITAVLELQDGTNVMGTVTNVLTLGVASAETNSFENTGLIKVPNQGTSGPSGPYPSVINVSGMTGTLTRLTVTITDITHAWPEDMDILLVGPGGQTVLLMSDAGNGTSLSGVTLAFDDDAAQSLPDEGPIVTGTFRPSDYEAGDTFSAPAPAGAYGTALSGFIGSDPNGAWSLYGMDDGNRDKGQINGGWGLTIVSTGPPTCCTDVATGADLSVGINDAPDPLNLGSNVTYTVTVANAGPGAALNVMLTNTLPAGFEFVSADSSQGNCANSGGTVTCDLGVLLDASMATVAITAQANVAGSRTNAATVTSSTSDPVSANNSTTELTSVNSPPAVSDIPDLSTDEDTIAGPIAFMVGDAETAATALTVAGYSSDTNLVPTEGLVFGGSDGNRTLTVTPASNQFGNATITISVDDGMAASADTFVLTVESVNDQPVLNPIPDRTNHYGTIVTFTNVAADGDQPPDALAFSLDPGAPAGATVSATNGVFAWTPDVTYVGTSNTIAVRVTDDGSPPLDDSRSFVVVVVDAPAIVGHFATNGSVTVTWGAIPGQVYRVEYKNSLLDAEWIALPGDVTATGPTAMKIDATGFFAQRFYRITVLP